MSVNGVTLWLVYILVFLVVAIILSLPRVNMPNRGLVIVLFSAIVASVVITFIPVIQDPTSVMIQMSLLSMSYLLIIILVIIMAVSVSSRHSRMSMGSGSASYKSHVTCDSSGENCRFDSIKMKEGKSKVRVDFNNEE